MTLFLVFAAVLAVLAVALVAWPLLKPRASEAGTAPPSPARNAAVGVAAFLPVAAFALYFNLSEWPWDGSAETEAAMHGAGGMSSLGQAASQLEERLATAPGDAEGWKMLGRTYVVMGDYPKALTAYQKAFTLTSGQDMDAMLGYAEARVLVNEADFEGEAGQLFERAVQIDPAQPKALWYSGLTAFRRQDLETARARWAALRDLGAPEEILQILDTRIAEIDQSLGRSPEPPRQAAVAGAATTAAAMPPPAASGPAAPPTGDGIALNIVVAPELAARVPANTPLFILARGTAGGPPLAAVRRSSGELPLSLTLTDANAMIPGTSLKQVDELTIVARVSLSGRPVASSGDLYGEVRYDPAASGPMTVTIDRAVD